MKLLFDSDKFVAQWVAQRLGLVIGFGSCSAIGVIRHERLIAGVVYHDYRPTYASLQMSVAAEPKIRWATPQNLRAFFYYPFEQLQCQSVYVACAKENLHARAFVAKIGFKPVGLLRRGFRTDDAVLYDMLPSECAWLRSSDERLSIAAARA